MSIHRTIAKDEEEERRNRDIARLRASHDRLLAAAKEVAWAWDGGSNMGTLYEMGRAIPSIRTAIAAAEEQAP